MNNIPEMLYCRFCAEQTHAEELIDLRITLDIRKKINEILSFFSINWIDLDDKLLPETICSSCYCSFNNSYDLFVKIKISQALLSNLFSSKLKSEAPNLEYEETNICIKSESLIKDVDKFHDDDFHGSFDEVEPQHYDLDIKEDISWITYPWICNKCDLKLDSINDLREHSKDAHRKCCSFLCTDCNVMVNQFDSFVEHVTSHRESLKLYCQYCNHKYQDDDDIIIHIDQHHSVPQCGACGEHFQTYTELQNHKALYNIKTKNLRRKRERPITAEDLTCTICQKVTKSLSNLRTHKKLHTDRHRDFFCDRCGKSFFTKGALTTHNLIHENPDPQICKICKKSFLTLTRLKKHVNTHYGQKPFQCAECKKCFRLKDQLKGHMITHTDFCPYKCQYCNKGFKFKNVLKNHELIHTGARPYSCDICSMDFTCWSNCNKHMKRKHGTTLAKSKMTANGKMPISSKNKLKKIKEMDGEIKEWTERIMVPLKRGKKVDAKD